MDETVLRDKNKSKVCSSLGINAKIGLTFLQIYEACLRVDYLTAVWDLQIHSGFRRQSKEVGPITRLVYS